MPRPVTTTLLSDMFESNLYSYILRIEETKGRIPLKRQITALSDDLRSDQLECETI